jgi:hypothetical protein
MARHITECKTHGILSLFAAFCVCFENDCFVLFSVSVCDHVCWFLPVVCMHDGLSACGTRQGHVSVVWPKGRYLPGSWLVQEAAGTIEWPPK